VKTFAKEKNGNVSFYKDGYTDLRGRFDYASLSTSSIDTIEKFAIFIMSDDLGMKYFPELTFFYTHIYV
jgi:hypothetical protein